MFFVETGLLTLPMDLQYRYQYWYRPVLRDEVLVSVVSVKSGIGATLVYIAVLIYVAMVFWPIQHILEAL